MNLFEVLPLLGSLGLFLSLLSIPLPYSEPKPNVDFALYSLLSSGYPSDWYEDPDEVVVAGIYSYRPFVSVARLKALDSLECERLAEALGVSGWRVRVVVMDERGREVYEKDCRLSSPIYRRRGFGIYDGELVAIILEVGR